MRRKRQRMGNPAALRTGGHLMSNGHVTPDRVRYVAADSFAPETADGEELWWMGHYECDCGWESHDSQTTLPDDGLTLARQHVAETGHQFADDAETQEATRS
jgi:hypothetical protein